MKSPWRVAVQRLVAATLLMLSSPAVANDFGGPTTGGGGDDAAGDSPGCDDSWSCCGAAAGGPGAAGNPGGGGGGGPAGVSQLQMRDSGGVPSAIPSLGKPVAIYDGREMLSHTDIVIPGILPIRFTRHYESSSTYDSPLGYGWSHTYDMQLFEYTDGSVLVRSGCGQRTRYVYSGGAYVTPAGKRATLTQDGSTGRFTLRWPNGQKAHFDVEGRLEALADPIGNRHEVLYDARGKLPLTGTSPQALDPGTPMTVAQVYRITKVRERAADGTLTGRFIDLTYDEATGRLTEVESHDGRSVGYAHDVHAGTGLTIGNLVQVEGLEGILHTFVYDDRNAQGVLQDAHNVTSIQLGQGTTPWANTYDASDRVTRQVRGDGQVDFDWSVPLKTTVTRTIRDYQGQNPTTAVEVHEFDAQGYPTKYVDPLKNEWRTTWSTAKRATREEVWQNDGTIASPVLSLLRAVDFGFDATGNLVSKSVTLDSGEVVTESWTRDHDWVASRQVVSSLAPTKIFRTEYTFYRDSEGVPVKIQEIKRRRDDGSFQVTHNEYNANGQLIAITPPTVTPTDGLKVKRMYFAPPEANPGLLKEESLEVGGSPDPHLKRTFTYDAAGFLASVTDARSNATSYANDDLGRVTTITNPLGEQMLYTYAGTTLGVVPGSWTPGANLAEVEVGRTSADGEGQVRRLRFDAEGRLREIERKDDAGTFSTFMAYAYDSDQNRTRETDALGRVTAHSFDALRRLTSTTDAAASPNTTSFAYDAEGNRIQVIDALGRKTVLVYDHLGRMIESQAHGSPSQPLSPVLTTAFEYDAAGNVTKVIDPKDQETAYHYSALSDLTAVTQHLGQTVSYAYDARGRLARVTNARGQVLVHVYGPLGGLAEVRHFPTAVDADAGTNLERTVSYAYDASGNLTETGDTDHSSSDPNLETTVYDELDRPELVTVHYVPGGDRTLESAYDRFGNRKSLVFTDGSDVLTHSWTYDKLNRLVQADLASANPIEFTYYANDDLETITHGNGVTTEYAYFDEGPVEAITVESPSNQLLRLTYTVDKLLNVAAITEQHDAAGPNHAYSYGYDALERLTSATYPTALGLPGSESFAYDDAGNREDPGDPNAYSYDANNRITGSPGKTWVYDGDGNPVSVNAGLASEETFTHDAQSRMRGYANAATGVSALYLNDPFARRIKKTVNGTTAWFLWDGDQLLAEFDGSGDRRRRYTYAGGFAPAEQVVSGTSGEEAQPVHADHLDAPRSLSDDVAETIWRGVHRAFGETVADEDPDGDLIDVRFSMRFPGQWEDAESGFHYNFYRSYAPSVSRYLEADPIGQASASPRNRPANAPWSLERRLLNGMATSVYAYAFESPTNVVDSLGLQGKIIDFPKGRTRPPGTGLPRGPADVIPIPPPRPPYRPIMNPRTILCAAGRVVGTAAAGGAAVYSVDCAFDRWFCYYGQNQMSPCACLKIFDENGLCCPIPGAGPECDPNACKE